MQDEGQYAHGTTGSRAWVRLRHLFVFGARDQRIWPKEVFILFCLNLHLRVFFFKQFAFLN